MRAPNIIFRVTNKCNLRCTYCYDGKNHEEYDFRDVNRNFEKNIDKICKAIREIIDYGDEDYPVELIFHGGEPLLVSADNYRKLLEKLKGLNLKFSVQTNGTLISNEFINLFQDYDFNVGISLDGYDEKSNSCRIYKNKKNSFNDCLKNIKTLKEKNMKFGVIMSINKEHLGNELELYRFIALNGINCNIRPVFPSSPEKINISCDEYTNFFCKLFDIWFHDSNELVKTHQISELYLELRKSYDCNFIEKTCESCESCFLNFISMDIDGDIYPCNRLYGINEYLYGNIYSNSMEEIMKKSNDLAEKRKKSINDKCSNCYLKDTCNGGCPANSYSYNRNILEKDFFCKSKLDINRYISNVLRGGEYNNGKSEY